MFGWKHGNSRLPIALSIVELSVDMDCQGCEKKVRRAISKLDGVDTVEIDVDEQKVTVTGYIDRDEVLRTVKRTGRAVEFWPYSYEGYYGDYYNAYYSQSLEQSQQISSYSRKYEQDYHECIEPSLDSSINGYYYYPRQSRKTNSTIDENAFHLFSDDNANACTIM